MVERKKATGINGWWCVGELIGHLTVTCVRGEPEGDILHPTTDDPRVEWNAVSPPAGVPGQDEASEGARMACIIKAFWWCPCLGCEVEGRAWSPGVQ